MPLAPMNTDPFVDRMEMSISMSASVLAREPAENTQKEDAWVIAPGARALYNWPVLNRESLLTMPATCCVLDRNWITMGPAESPRLRNPPLRMSLCRIRSLIRGPK